MPDYPSGTFNELDSAVKENLKKWTLFNSSLNIENLVETNKDIILKFKNLPTQEVESLWVSFS